MKSKILIVMAILLVLNTAYAFEINPPIITISGNNGKFVMQSVEIYNDRDQETVVNISVVGITNYFLYKTVYVLKPYERRTITFGFTISGSQSGLINYEYDGNIVSQQVYITSEKTIMVFPPNPKAGSMISIVSPSKMGATGFLSCSETGHMYSVVIPSGVPFTFINLSKDDYGSAMLLLIWEDGEITYNFINITKEVTSSGELSINIDSDIKKGDTKIAVLSLGSSGVKGVLMIIKPSGSQILKDTDENGRASITFDESGSWIIIGHYGNKTVSKSVNVSVSKITINLDKEVNVGSKMEITVNQEEGNYEINTPKNKKVTGSFSNGKITFTPDVGGDYTINVVAGNVNGSETFTAYYNPIIVIKDQNGNYVFGSLLKNNLYNIEVIDRNTQSYISSINTIEVYRSGMTSDRIFLFNGKGTWQPKDNGLYMLSVEGNYIVPYERQVSVYSKSGFNWWYIWVIVICVIVILLFVFRKKIGGLFKEGSVPYKP